MHDEKWIGFDLDDVLANLREPMGEGLGKIPGASADWRSWSTYDFFSAYMSSTEFLQMIIDDKMLELCQPEPDAATSIERLRREGFKIAIVTARGYHPQAREITETWLSHHNMEVDRLEIVMPGESKSGKLKAIAGLVAYIDDHVDHLHKMTADTSASDSIELYLMSRPWNIKNQTYCRLDNVAQYADSLLKRPGRSAQLKFN